MEINLKALKLFISMKRNLQRSKENSLKRQRVATIEINSVLK